MQTTPRAAAAVTLCALAALVGPAGPVAAEERRFVEDATRGLSLPGTVMGGDHDATAVVQNPAGLVWLGHWHVEAAFTALDEDQAQGAGTGVGVYAAQPLQLPLLPRLGFGAAVEQLYPPRIALAPDPGEPLRLSLAAGWLWQPGVAIGAAWRYFVDDAGGPLDGAQSLDLGVSARFGAHWAVGAVVRDVNTPRVGGVAVQRRYQLELISRPTGSDRLELGLYGSLGERRLDGDAALRVSLRVAPGLWVKGEVAALSRHELVDPAFDTGPTDDALGFRASLGVEISFGGVGLALHGTGGRGAGGGTSFLGATAIVRYSGERLSSVIPEGGRMEKLDLTGALTSPQLTSVLLAMRRMERDPDVKAVILRIDGALLGWASAQEVRGSIARLRARGKKVVALLTAGGTRDYYVAAAADRVLLDAGGGLRLQGLVGVTLYYKGLFDRLGVRAQFEKIEEYKAAPEAFTQEGPSPEAAMVRDALFDDIYGKLTADLAADRKTSPDAVKKLIDDGPYTAGEAGEAKLVDAVVEPVDLDLRVAEALGGRLWPLGRPERARADRWARPRIAVVYIDGDIVDGKSRTIPLLGTKLVGGETIAEAIAAARRDPSIAAIVLRIDSPGGSALASELMAREVEQTRGVKPIIVSMGDIAASGGYFAAAYGEVIFASPSTITGSIGIFTGKVDVSGLLASLGLRWDTITRGAHADQESYYRPYTDEERKNIKAKLRYYYDRFVGAVARGRKMKVEDVDAVARGRVWTGAQARDKGLVDRIGGVVDAIEEAKRRAGFRDDELVEIVTLPAMPQGLLGAVLKLAGGDADGGDASATMSVAAIGEALGLPLGLLPWSVLLAGDAPQARLPFAIVE